MVSVAQGINTNLVLDNTVSVNYQTGMSRRQTKVMKEKPNFLAAHREAAGMADHELAKKVGTSQPQINRLENGERKLTIDWLQRIAVALDKSVPELLEPPLGTIKETPKVSLAEVGISDSPPVQSPPNAGLANEPTRTTRRRIDILGRAAGGKEGKFILNGEKQGYILAPPSVEAVSKAYALYIFGNSMSPRYEDGEMVIANPEAPYGKGSYVVAQLYTDEEGVFECYVKRFVSFGKELVLEQLNPPKGHDAIMRFPANRVYRIDKLVGPDGK
ncbi:phage repressor protein C with HTH and peptisase S24 domain [Bradyrhizobium elkanii]|uniref:LexA family transcriptional regulator n=1 Tax=Bradyrhizobium elkanii TaxID=29448 RepID=UPI00098204CB|nr:helix-turn-helix domain-containing protein [Bradyrhizobium elkanii]MCW2195095.1 phage repressor protein C with HTH and peptisase S24 domain [Bradyrhizobium elkanii]NWL67213.1 helix-turn-helix domain-containing protein [Bradyrhizobium elkanii]